MMVLAVVAATLAALGLATFFIMRKKDEANPEAAEPLKGQKFSLEEKNWHTFYLDSHPMRAYTCGAPDAPKLLFIHNLHSSTALCAPLVNELAKTHRVLCIDLPGHGGSDEFCTYTLELFAQCAREAVNQFFGGEKFVTVGHGIGAVVGAAVHVALKNSVSFVGFAPTGLAERNTFTKCLIQALPKKLAFRLVLRRLRLYEWKTLPQQRLSLALDDFTTQTSVRKCVSLDSRVCVAPLGEKELAILKDALTEGNAQLSLLPAKGESEVVGDRLGHWPEAKLADECVFCPKQAAQVVLDAEHRK